MDLFWNYESSLYSFEIGTIIAVIEGKLQFSLCATCVKVARQYKLIKKSVMYVVFFYRNAYFPLNHFFPLLLFLFLSIHFKTNGKYILFPNGLSQHERLSLLFHTIHMFVCTIQFHSIVRSVQCFKKADIRPTIYVCVWMETRKKTKIGRKKANWPWLYKCLTVRWKYI